MSQTSVNVRVINKLTDTSVHRGFSVLHNTSIPQHMTTDDSCLKILLDHKTINRTNRDLIRDKLMVCQSLAGQIMVCWSLVSDGFEACCSCKDPGSLECVYPLGSFYLFYLSLF